MATTSAAAPAAEATRARPFLARLAGEWPVLAIAAAFAGMALILPPAYDWPVIDSWAFGYTVQQLVEAGRLVLVDWGAMSLLAHVAWGALFSLPAGFSFAALNLSTWVLAFVLACASYAALRELDFAPLPSLMGAGVVLANPAVVLLSYSFMTDVPFLAWYTLAFWCYIRGLRRSAWPWLLAGSVFATIAVLIRQNGVVLPAALVAYVGWEWLRRRRPFPLRPALAAAALPVVALVVLTALSMAGVLSSRTNALAWIGAPAPARWAADLFRMALYLGLFMLPLTLAAGLRYAARFPRLTLRDLAIPAGAFILFAVLAIYQYYHPLRLPYIGTWRLMPYFPAVWSIFGTGSEGEWLAGARDMIFGYRFWTMVTAAGCAGAALLIWPAFWRRLAPLPLPSPRLGREAVDEGFPLGFLVLAILAFLAPVLLFSGEIYERYLAGLLLPLAALVLHACRRTVARPSLPAWALVSVVFLAFGLALAGEFVAWNGAAWHAGDRVAATGAPAEKIDAGFVWNGWHFAEEVRRTELQPPADAPAYMELTPQIDRTYVVSFSPLAGYETIGREEYWSPLRWSVQELLVLRKTTG